MSRDGEFWNTVRSIAKSYKNPVQIGQITSLEPLSVQFQGIEINTENGDTIYINNLLLDKNIDLDLPSMNMAQNIATVTPPPLIKGGIENANYTGTISGTQKQFVTELYNWIKEHHDRFILHIGDFVAIQKLGNNTYIIVGKLQVLRSKK